MSTHPLPTHPSAHLSINSPNPPIHHPSIHSQFIQSFFNPYIHSLFPLCIYISNPTNTHFYSFSILFLFIHSPIHYLSVYIYSQPPTHPPPIHPMHQSTHPFTYLPTHPTFLSSIQITHSSIHPSMEDWEPQNSEAAKGFPVDLWRRGSKSKAGLQLFRKLRGNGNKC